MVLYDKWLCWRLLLYVLLIFDLLETIPFCKMLMAQWSFHSNNSTGNENVTASPLDYSAIVRDWQTMFAQDEIMIQLIHSRSLHRTFEVRPTQTKSTGGSLPRQILAKYINKIYYIPSKIEKNGFQISFFTRPMWRQIFSFFINSDVKVNGENDLEWTWSSNKFCAFQTCSFF